jgi:acyl-CoA thioesterase-1
VIRLIVVLVFGLAVSSARADETRILVFGDSISAGYGLPHIDKGWVALLQAKLHEEGYGASVINASVSGETTAGGLERLPRALAIHHPGIVILELGGNDGLRALPISAMRDNLASMIKLARAHGAQVLLLGIRIPPNYGPQYTEQFDSSYDLLGRELHLPVLPFLFDGIALVPGMMQDDGIHPAEGAQPRLLANVWPLVKPLLRR